MNEAILNETFFQAKLKVYRAKRHLDEAQSLFARYVNTDFCRLVIDTETEPGTQLVRAVADPIPAHIVLAIGDTFHNMNAAMDYIMTGMMRAAGLSAKRVSFPTNESRQQLRKSFMAPKPGRGFPTNRRIVEGFPAFVMLLLTTIKPYPGGNFLLWEITKADNIDKHNLIIPTVAVTELRGVHLEDVTNNNVFRNISMGLPPGGVINAINYGVSGTLEIRDKGKATASITFPQTSEVFAGDPVFPTLAQCIEGVEQAIALIESANFKLFVKS